MRHAIAETEALAATEAADAALAALHTEVLGEHQSADHPYWLIYQPWNMMSAAFRISKKFIPGPPFQAVHA